MLSGCFVDTNVILYLKDPAAPSKRARAREWLDALVDRRLIVISPQVLNEFAHNVIRKFPHVEHDELFANVEAMRPWCRAPMTDRTALDALALRRRFRIAFYDAALISAALASRCEIFLSEDLSHGSRMDAVRVINPFVTPPIPFLQAT